MPPNTQTPNYIQHENGLWYASDENGIVYSPEFSDAEGTLTREVETGNMVDDPTTGRNVYSITGYGDEDLTGYRLTHLGRMRRRKGINSLIGKRGLMTPFEKYLGRDLRRRDFKDQAFVEDLASRTYTASDFNLKRTGDRLANSVATRIADIAYPSLRKKVEGAKYDKVTKPTYTTYWIGSDCPTCGIGNAGFVKVITGYRKGLERRPAKHSLIAGEVLSEVQYDQKPEMRTEYAVPVELISRSSVETRTNTKPKPKASTNRIVRKNNTQTSTKPIAKQSKPTTVQPDITEQQTTTWLEFPGGGVVPGSTNVGDWVTLN